MNAKPNKIPSYEEIILPFDMNDHEGQELALAQVVNQIMKQKGLKGIRLEVANKNPEEKVYELTKIYHCVCALKDYSKTH